MSETTKQNDENWIEAGHAGHWTPKRHMHGIPDCDSALRRTPALFMQKLQTARGSQSPHTLVACTFERVRTSISDRSRPQFFLFYLNTISALHPPIPLSSPLHNVFLFLIIIQVAFRHLLDPSSLINHFVYLSSV